MTPTLPPDDLVPDCARVRGELAGFVYDELAPDTRLAVERHLAGCVPCSEELAAVSDTRRVLSRWETPAAEEDPRALARSIAALAGTATPAETPATPVEPVPAYRPRRARLVRWSAMLSGAAAAGLFVLSVLHAQASFEQGRFELSFGLPGTSAPAPAAVQDGLAGNANQWRDEMRTIAAQEVALRTAGLEESQAELIQRIQQMTGEELLRLAQALDAVLAQKQEAFDASLVRLGQEARQADLEQQRVLTSLVNYLPVSQTNR